MTQVIGVEVEISIRANKGDASERIEWQGAESLDEFRMRIADAIRELFEAQS